MKKVNREQRSSQVKRCLNPCLCYYWLGYHRLSKDMWRRNTPSKQCTLSQNIRARVKLRKDGDRSRVRAARLSGDARWLIASRSHRSRVPIPSPYEYNEVLCCRVIHYRDMFVSRYILYSALTDAGCR